MQTSLSAAMRLGSRAEHEHADDRIEEARVVDEVKVAFRLSQGLFAELADSLPA